MLILSFVHLAAGAAEVQTPVTIMDKAMHSWMGVHIDAVKQHWGKPTDEAVTDTTHFYYWSGSHYTDGANPNYVNNGNYSVNFQPLYYCDRTLEVNASKRVTGWQYRGSGCPETYEAVKQWVNPYNNPWTAKRPCNCSKGPVKNAVKKTAPAKTAVKPAANTGADVKKAVKPAAKKAVKKKTYKKKTAKKSAVKKNTVKKPLAKPKTIVKPKVQNNSGESPCSCDVYCPYSGK